jgi:hypothetical protein
MDITPKYEILTDPWPHVIIDGFLDKSDFDKLISLKYKEDVSLKKPMVSTYKIIEEKYASQFPDRVAQSLKAKWKDIKPPKWKDIKPPFVLKQRAKEGCIIENKISFKLKEKYEPFLIEMMKKMNPEKAHLHDYTEIQVASTHKDTVYRMHTDNADKLLTCVVYLKPEANTGTVMSDAKNGKDLKVVDWKQNRAFIFSAMEGKSWHRWQGDKINTRHVLIFILRCEQSKVKGDFSDDN